MDNQYLKNIHSGMKVVILTSQNRTSIGIVDDIAARNPYHENGIMVRLKNGDVGRVKEIILNEEEKNDKAISELKKIIDKGETYKTEFKSSMFWSLNYSQEQIKESKSFELREYGQKASKVIIAKSIASFLNSDGGDLIIGVREDKTKGGFEIAGVNEDLNRIKQAGADGYKRTFIDEIIRAFFPAKIFNHLNTYINFEFVNDNDKLVFWIKVRKSDSRVFLKINDKEVFMIRVDSENRTLEGEKLVDYCIKKWGGR